MVQLELLAFDVNQHEAAEADGLAPDLFFEADRLDLGVLVGTRDQLEDPDNSLGGYEEKLMVKSVCYTR